jgi:hypothetical protein
MESFQKRQRDRKKREKRVEKADRRKDRADSKKQREIDALRPPADPTTVPTEGAPGVVTPAEGGTP